MPAYEQTELGIPAAPADEYVPPPDEEFTATCFRCGEAICPVPPEDQYMQGGPFLGRDGWAWCGDWDTHRTEPLPGEKPGEWGVQVNETAVSHTNRPGEEWWFTRSEMLRMSGKLREVRPGFGGGIVWIGPWSWEGATFMREHMIRNGVPKGVTKLTREPKTERKAA